VDALCQQKLKSLEAQDSELGLFISASFAATESAESLLKRSDRDFMSAYAAALQDIAKVSLTLNLIYFIESQVFCAKIIIDKRGIYIEI
jgi:hypothetical protein